MEDINVIWILIGMGVMVLGPAGAVWADIRRQVHSLTEQWNRERTETQAWLKSLQSSTSQNERHIAVLLDRIER